jgi:hypothetical protein
MIVGAGEELLSAELTQSSASLCEFCGPSALSGSKSVLNNFRHAVGWLRGYMNIVSETLSTATLLLGGLCQRNLRQRRSTRNEPETVIDPPIAVETLFASLNLMAHAGGNSAGACCKPGLGGRCSRTSET